MSDLDDLDALVAERVMGWEQVSFQGELVWRRPLPDNPSNFWARPWRFSRSHAGCGLVLARLREMGCQVEITIRPTGDVIARVQPPGRGTVVAVAVATTVPHAVCSAAVEAVGTMKPDTSAVPSERTGGVRTAQIRTE